LKACHNDNIHNYHYIQLMKNHTRGNLFAYEVVENTRQHQRMEVHHVHMTIKIKVG
jgi:hypothetical protein